MVWYGMVWYGMVWYGMVWYGMVWYGMVWYGMVWYGMVIYSGLIFILHILFVFFINMSRNILSFFIKYIIALFAKFGSDGMSDIHWKSVKHQVQL
jgi:hypothetical protein